MGLGVGIGRGMGGMGASTILGAINNKLLPAAIMWIPTGAQIPKTTDSGLPELGDSLITPAPDAGTRPEGSPAPIIDGLSTAIPGNPSNARSLIFSCVEQESMDATATVTNFPVSTGFNVSDHVFRNNPVITMQGIVSNIDSLAADFTSLPSILKISGAILKSPLGGLAANALEFGKTLSGGNKIQTKVEEFHTTLETLCMSGQLVQVATLRGIYSDCVITKYSTSAGVDSSSTLAFTITLERVNVVTTKNADGTPNVQAQNTKPLVTLNTVGKEKIERYKESLGIGVLGAVAGGIL